jgi:hypothetical protein
VKIDMAMLRRCIVSPCAAHDLRGLVTERTLGVSSVDDVEDDNGYGNDDVVHCRSQISTTQGAAVKAAAPSAGRSAAKASLDRRNGQKKSRTIDDDEKSARIEVRKRILAGRQKAGFSGDKKVLNRPEATESVNESVSSKVTRPKELSQAGHKVQQEEDFSTCASVDASSLLEGRASRAKAMFGEREVRN